MRKRARRRRRCHDDDDDDDDDDNDDDNDDDSDDDNDDNDDDNNDNNNIQSLTSRPRLPLQTLYKHHGRFQHPARLYTTDFCGEAKTSVSPH